MAVSPRSDRLGLSRRSKVAARPTDGTGRLRRWEERLLDVAACVISRSVAVLGLGERVVDRRLAGERRREELADGGAEPWNSGIATNCTPV